MILNTLNETIIGFHEETSYLVIYQESSYALQAI